MEVFIPSFRYEESELERGYTVRCAGAGHARASGRPCGGGQRGLRWGSGQASACRGRPALPAQASPDLPSAARPCPASPVQLCPALPYSPHPCPALPHPAVLRPALSSFALTSPAHPCPVQPSHPCPSCPGRPLRAQPCPAQRRPSLPCPSRHRKGGLSLSGTCYPTRALFCGAPATAAGAA